MSDLLYKTPAVNILGDETWFVVFDTLDGYDVCQCGDDSGCVQVMTFDNEIDATDYADEQHHSAKNYAQIKGSFK